MDVWLLLARELKDGLDVYLLVFESLGESYKINEFLFIENNHRRMTDWLLILEVVNLGSSFLFA